METTQQLTVSPLAEIGAKLNECVLSVIGKEKLQGFERAFLMAEAMQRLKELLTPEYMAPIMQLQGSKLGFRTDKDKNKDGSKGPGYPMETVKDCLIEAVLMGLEVTGNQFNIIAGNTYATKEGCGALLAKFPGLKQTITPTLPRMKDQSAAVIMKIEWTLNGESYTKEIDIPVKVYAGFTTADAVVGKATRKARHWLYSHITGTEIGEGEVEDVNATVVSSKQSAPELSQVEVEANRRLEMLKSCTSPADLDILVTNNPDFDADLIAARRKELTPAKSMEEIQREQTLKAKESVYDQLSDKDKASDKGQTLLFEIDQLKGGAK